MRIHRLVASLIAYLALFLFLASCQTEEETGGFATGLHNPRQHLKTQDSRLSVEPFLVQLADFEDVNEANAYAQKVQQSNLSSFVVADSISFMRPIYRVRVGPFATEEAAFAHLSSLRKQGFKEAYIIKIEGLTSSALTLSNSRVGVEPERARPSPKKQLTFSGGCSTPKWSPNGQEIAFYRKIDDSEGIYTVGSGGGHVSRIIESTDERRITSEFAWASSGEKLAVKAEEATQNWEPAEAVWIVDKRGAASLRALQISAEWQSIVHLSWSPDDAYLAVGLKDTELTSASNTAVRVMIVKSPAPAFLGDDTRDSQAEKSRVIEPLSYPDTRIIAGGWRDPNHYLYISWRPDINEANGESVHEYTLLSYDLDTEQSALIGTVLKPKLLEHFQLAPSKDRGVLFGPAGMLAVDLADGREIPIADGEFESMPVKAIDISKSNQMYLLSNGELRSCDFRGEVDQARVKMESRTLTVSPLGTKLVGTKLGFVEAGDLFTLRTTPK